MATSDIVALQAASLVGVLVLLSVLVTVGVAVHIQMLMYLILPRLFF